LEDPVDQDVPFDRRGRPGHAVVEIGVHRLPAGEFGNPGQRLLLSGIGPGGDQDDPVRAEHFHQPLPVNLDGFSIHST
jgi:hypothetical protein